MTEILDDVCSTCGKAKNVVGSGSLTQWINTCRCDQVPISDQEQTTICRLCNKRIAETRAGSVTQWIFSEHQCKCASPQPMTIRGSRSAYKSKSFEEDDEEISGEAAIDVDGSLFPTDRYKPLAMLGQGALGQVFLCRDIHLRKKVAVKSLLALTVERIVSFQQEAKIASKLNHENVIKVFDFGTSTGGRPYMVLEYFPGQSLQELIEERQFLEEDESIVILRSMCQALGYLHEQGTFHRDLKPSNILLRQIDLQTIDLRLIDFGLSKTTQDVQSKTDVQGRTVVGTPSYMSPDQAFGLEYDARSEIYSLGCIMFEMIAGRPPFLGESSLEVLNKHQFDEVPDLKDFAPDVSNKLCDLIEKCLRKDPADRFQSVQEILAELATFATFEIVETSAQASKIENIKASVERKPQAIKVIVVLVAFGAIALFFLVQSIFRPSDVPTTQSNFDDPIFHPGMDLKTEKQSEFRDQLKRSKRHNLGLRNATDDDLKALEGNRSLNSLDLTDSSVTDKGIKSLTKIPVLTNLYLTRTKVTTLRGIGKCKRLNTLVLDETAVNDSSIDELIGAKCFRLSLAGTKITTDCLSKLATLPRLNHLNIARTSLKSEAIDSLANLKKLDDLDVSHTGLTGNDIRELLTKNLNLSVVVFTGDDSEIEQLEREFPAVRFRASKVPLMTTWMTESEVLLKEHGDLSRVVKLLTMSRKAMESRKHSEIELALIDFRLGQTFVEQGKYAQGAELFEKSLAVAERVKDMKVVISILNAQFALAAKLGDHAKAEVLASRALQLAEENYERGAPEKGELRLGYLSYLVSIGQYKKCLMIAEQIASQIVRDRGSTESPESAAIAGIQGTCYFNMKQPDLALKKFLDAQGRFKEIPSQLLSYRDVDRKINNIMMLTKLYLAKKDYKEALVWSDEAMAELDSSRKETVKTYKNEIYKDRIACLEKLQKTDEVQRLRKMIGNEKVTSGKVDKRN